MFSGITNQVSSLSSKMFSKSNTEEQSASVPEDGDQQIAAAAAASQSASTEGIEHNNAENLAGGEKHRYVKSKKKNTILNQ